MSNMNGEEWKVVRSAFSPIFTSGKLKGMFHFVKRIAENLTEEMAAKADQGTDFELKEVFGKFRKVSKLCWTLKMMTFKLRLISQPAPAFFYNVFLECFFTIIRLGLVIIIIFKANL